MVVASLVRSNAAGDLGFLGEPERINVLLSRAKHGMIIIGDTRTLRAARSPAARRQWGIVLDNLESSGAVRAGLPAVCQLHGHVHMPELDSPAAFAERSPDGGCTKPCHAKLGCGHRCTLSCHAFDRGHAAVQCREPVHDYCPEGHLVLRECCSAALKCQTCHEVSFAPFGDTLRMTPRHVMGHETGRTPLMARDGP